MKKRTAFKVGLAILVALFFFTAWRAPDALPSVGVTIVLAIAGATIGYQAVQAADNAFRGKYYRPELDREARKVDS
jgi:hypothetical protein